MKLSLFLLAATTAVALAPNSRSAPTGLMCELLAEPERAAITDATPEFTWMVPGERKDELQTAYEIRVGSSPEALESEKRSLWSTGKIRSDQSTAVTYTGRPLQSNQTYWWKVRTWNRSGKSSPWSAPQRFRTGVLRAAGAAGGTRKPEDRITVTRYPLVRSEVAPTAVTEVGDRHYFLDFGRAAFAGLRLTVDSPQPGQRLVVHLGEALDGPRRVHRKPGGSIRYHRAEVELKPGRNTYLVPLGPKDGREMPPHIGPVMPYRYVEIENSPARLDRESARQLVAHYPFDDAAARFTSSDRKLNDIWELCRYSMKATSFCGVYVDGDRERLPYEADAYINQLGHYASDREFTLARYSHEYLMLHPTWPTEWILHSPLMAWADYMHTGDADSLVEFYPDLKAKTLLALARPDGLISTVEPGVSKEVLASVYSTRMRDIVDWPMAERDGYEMRPVNTVVNAFHYRSLVLMARIAEVLEKPQDAREFRQAAERVAKAIHTRLYDAKTGLYVDGEGSAHSSLHANLFPLAFDLVPADRRAKVAEFVRSKGMACSVYAAQYLMEALYSAGLDDHALALMTAPGDRSWAHMVYDVGTTITLEAWDNKYKPNQDWNHAWGAAPANIIPRFVMGVEPLEPAFRTVQIRPQPGNLEHAALDLPTVRGPIHVAFQAKPQQFVLTVRLPANTRAEVHLPRRGTTSSEVWVDGKKRKARIEGDFLVVEGIGSGEHQFALKGLE